MRSTIEVKGARENNLQNVHIEIPRDKLVVITGVSGSGKSSVLNETLVKILMNKLYKSKPRITLTYDYVNIS